MRSIGMVLVLRLLASPAGAAPTNLVPLGKGETQTRDQSSYLHTTE